MKKVLPKPRFYPNPDNSHCVQACLKSVLSVTHPELHFTWENLEQITDYVPGHGSWVYAELLAFEDFDIETKLISSFDINRFIEDDILYIEQEFGSQMADYERAYSHDYEKIKSQMNEALERGLITQRAGSFDDIRSLIDSGWYVMLVVNSKALNQEEGYFGHRVLVYGYDEHGVIMHDPGDAKRSFEAREVRWDRLKSAWQGAYEILALRHKV